MALIFPAIPPEPGPGALPAEWDVYLRAVAINNNALDTQAKEALAAAQNDTAAAIRESAATLSAPVPHRKPTRAELAWGMYEEWPHTREQTDGAVLNTIKTAVDAFVAKFPGYAAD